MGSNSMPSVLACELLGIGTKISITKLCNGINWRRNWAEPMRILMMRFDAYGCLGAQIAWTERSRRFYEASSTCQLRTQCQCIRDACTVNTAVPLGLDVYSCFEWCDKWPCVWDKIFSYNSSDGSAHTPSTVQSPDIHGMSQPTFCPLFVSTSLFLIISASIYSFKKKISSRRVYRNIECPLKCAYPLSTHPRRIYIQNTRCPYCFFMLTKNAFERFGGQCQWIKLKLR